MGGDWTGAVIQVEFVRVSGFLATGPVGLFIM